MLSHLHIMGCQYLAALVAVGLAVGCAGQAQCTDKENVTGRSMLNLAVRMLPHMKPVEEEIPTLMPPETFAILNESVDLNHSGLEPPQKKNSHTGLPGDVVVTTVVVKCGEPVFSPMGYCPDECPFYAQDTKKRCYFSCLPKRLCGTAADTDPEERVPDLDAGVCRKCNTRGCKTCAPGPVDKCSECSNGWTLQADGTCVSEFMNVWFWIILVVAVLLAFLMVWVLQLWCAPVTNAEGLQEGLAFRSSVKMHMPPKDDPRKVAVVDGDEDEAQQSRDLFPISTNLHVTQVAGPGLTLHMNFQLASIMWACAMVVLWLFFVYLTDARQLTIGMLPAETHAELCAVTLQGRALQEDQMPMKVVFVALVYLITFFGAIAYGVVNARSYEHISDETTMADFAALVTGLPPLSGDQKWEEQLTALFAEKTAEKVVGVSICWDFGDQADDVQNIIDDDLSARENYPPPSDYVDNRGLLRRRVFAGVDSLVGGILGLAVPDGDDKESPDEGQITQMLTSMRSTGSAFVVFDTESARDRAVETTAKFSKGVPFKVDGKVHLLRLQTEQCEPKVVNWENFNVTTTTFVCRVVGGIIIIMVACAIYALCFYLPYAYYQSMFKFPNEPGAVEGFMFSMLVVAGNQIMYQICAALADWVGFRFSDRSEGLYVALYVLAVLLSVAFDMTVEFYLGYHSLADARVSTADGRDLSSLTSYQEIFESYPMQKVLGKRLFDYCFPATFLIPFLVEPVGTIVAPFFVQKLLLRTHPEVRGRNAEKSVECFAPMDLGRYGDILVNLWLAILILFFPSGNTLPILLTYAVSHMYIYAYDQYRILRCLPAFTYATDEVDKYAQLLMIFPCCTLASCVVWKANCAFDGSFCLFGYDIAGACALAFAVHGIVHLFILEFVIPAVARQHQHLQAVETYGQVAAKLACNWFSSNPIHCLRSKYIYKDSPSCCYWMAGKQHLIRKNPKIGCYYENRKKTTLEEY